MSFETCMGELLNVCMIIYNRGHLDIVDEVKRGVIRYHNVFKQTKSGPGHRRNATKVYEECKDKLYAEYSDFCTWFMNQDLQFTSQKKETTVHLSTIVFYCSDEELRKQFMYRLFRVFSHVCDEEDKDTVIEMKIKETGIKSSGSSGGGDGSFDEMMKLFTGILKDVGVEADVDSQELMTSLRSVQNDPQFATIMKDMLTGVNLEDPESITEALTKTTRRITEQ